MCAIIGFAVLLAGVGAVAAHISEPRRYTTDMVPLASEADRLTAYSAVGQGAVRTTPAAQPISGFETTVSSPAAAAAVEPASQPAGFQSGSNLDAATRDALARDIQTELARLGCYAGPVDGVWTPAAERAAEQFVAKANARIAVTEPDFALFSLTKTGTADQACGPALTVAQKPAIEAPQAMGLGGPVERKPTRTTSYHNDRSVQSLFTNPLGR